VIGAERHDRSGDRTTYRHGYRTRTSDTRVRDCDGPHRCDVATVPCAFHAQPARDGVPRDARSRGGDCPDRVCPARSLDLPFVRTTGRNRSPNTSPIGSEVPNPPVRISGCHANGAKQRVKSTEPQCGVSGSSRRGAGSSQRVGHTSRHPHRDLSDVFAITPRAESVELRDRARLPEARLLLI